MGTADWSSAVTVLRPPTASLFHAAVVGIKQLASQTSDYVYLDR